MSGNAQNRARPGQRLAKRRPGAAVGIVLDGVHRIAMSDKQRRHARRRRQMGESVVQLGHGGSLNWAHREATAWPYIASRPRRRQGGAPRGAGVGRDRAPFLTKVNFH